MKGLNGKKILVCGAASGIGKSIAERLHEEGVKIFLGDFDVEGVKKVAEKLGANYAWFDLTKFESIPKLVETAAENLGEIDGLVNNAAVLDSSAMEKDIDILHMDVSTWQRMLNGNLIAYGLLIKEILPHFFKNNGGSIVNISSITVHMDSSDEPAYVTSKAGVNSLTRHVAIEYGKNNIRCNAIAPGCIAHERFREVMPQEFMDNMQKKIKIPRLGKPEDIAGLTAFLLSDDAEWITGQVWAVDGGQTMRE